MAAPRKVTFQVGVDVLGFPMYVTHTIYQGTPTRRYPRYAVNREKGYWIKVVESTSKQH